MQRYDLKRFGNEKNGVVTAPEFRQETKTDFSKFTNNSAVFFKPTPDRQISLQALRPNQYNFSDNFINKSTDFLEHSVKSGDNNGLKKLLSSQDAQNAITIADNPDAVVDLNNLKDFWRFILYIKTFNNRRMANSGSSHTVIISGRCDAGEEPFIERGGRLIANPHCELIIENKTVFQSYDLDMFGQTGLKKHTTKSSNSYAYQGLINNTVNETLYENTPGGMNFSAGLVNSGSALGIDKDPVHVVGQYGVSGFDRRQVLPGYALKNTFNAISNTFKERDRKSISSVLDHESGMTSMFLSDNSIDYTNLIENIKEEEDRTKIWSMDQFGPGINDRVLVTALETEYGITDPIVIRGDSATQWTGSDQISISSTNICETMLEKILPTLMIEHQIHAISASIAMTEGSFGDVEINGNIESITPSIQLTQQEISQRWVILKDLLVSGVFKQIYDTFGGFTVDFRINITSTSFLAVNLLEYGMPDGHVREFFPADFAYTAPLIAKRDTVSRNQESLGYFLSRVCNETNDATDNFVGNMNGVNSQPAFYSQPQMSTPPVPQYNSPAPSWDAQPEPRKFILPNDRDLFSKR